ncbi:MAG: response regulator [Hydrococcus sp. RU_2_2]|nr:response regulator [Hydrococcus sp. RU_2_2]NJP18830.1 response regulator [Hydrococcus sp. CRU_1_1]
MHMAILQSRRILLVSDEQTVREITQICLETVVKCEVLTVSSSNERIVNAEAQQVNAILLDIDEKTSHTDWLALVQSLQNNPATQDIPIILLITNIQSHNLLQLGSKGIKAAIAKSFDLLALADRIVAALDWN